MSLDENVSIEENIANKEEVVDIKEILFEDFKTLDDIERTCTHLHLDSKFQLLKPLIRNQIEIFLCETDPDDIAIGESKIGGQPDLSNTHCWPKDKTHKSLSFICQLNCEEFDELDSENLLPKSGLISFFYRENSESKGTDSFKIIYTEDIDILKPVDCPDDLHEDDIYKAQIIGFENSLSVPDWQHEILGKLLSYEERSSYIKMSPHGDTQLLGHPTIIQNPMQTQCQMSSHGLSSDGVRKLSPSERMELEKGKEDWILLLQIASDLENTGMMWGDSGKLYVWIRKHDLKAQNFNDCCLCFQSH